MFTSKSIRRLILPAVCFIVSTVLAFRPMFVAEAGQLDGLFLFCIRMWLTFNIATLVFLFPYYRQRKLIRAAEEEDNKRALQEKQSEENPPSEQ